MLRRSAPVITLFLLAPLIAEYLLGSLPMAMIVILPIMAAMYGSGALLVREIARRKGGGWPMIAVLGLAYGVIEEGLITQWSFWAVTEVEIHSIRIVQTYDRNLHDTPAGKDTIAVATRLLQKPIGILEAHLAEQDYLVGDRFTVADLNLVEIVRYALSEKPFFANYPKVRAWVERCHDRDGFRKMMAGREAES